MSNNLNHFHHITCDTSQENITWYASSSSLLQKVHVIPPFFNWTCLLLIFVGNLSYKTLQIINKTFGGILIFHRLLNISSWCVPTLKLSKAKYDELIMNKFDGSGFQHQQSSPSPWITTLLIKELSSSTKVFFHSYQISLSFKFSLPPTSYPSIHFFHISFCSELTNRLANLYWNLSPPNHLSFQNLVLAPFPNFHSTNSSNHTLPSPPHTNFKSLHQINSWELTPPSPKASKPKYFEFKTLSHKAPLLWNKFHLHLASNLVILLHDH